MTTLDTVDSSSDHIETPQSSAALSVAVRLAPHVLVWTLLLAPAIRTLARGWRPLADDASIALGAWTTFSLHFPLVGIGTGAGTGPTGVQTTSNPGPLELWLLGPFVHLDQGQGALIGSALLCAAVLSVTIHVLRKTTGSWAAVIFALVVADLAVVSPTPFVDPVWNSNFAFFWFLGFVGIAFVVGQGNLRYLPLLLFFGSVTIDSHLLFLPSVAIVLVAAPVLGWFLRRPTDYRWLWWTGGVAFVCWIAPVCQQLFGAHPNISALLSSGGVGATDKTRTFGFVFGLRALSRAASLNPIWASPRSILPLPSANDVNHRNLLLCLVLPALIGIGFIAWKRKQAYVCSMAVITTGAAVGLVLMYSRIPTNYFLSFTWVNLLIWVVGVCIWLTFGLAAITAAKEFDLTPIHSDLATHPADLGARRTGHCDGRRYLGRGVSLREPGIPARLRRPARVKTMASIIEQQVPRAMSDLPFSTRGHDFFQTVEDEHGLAYLLRTAGWTPGMAPNANGVLGLPIHRNSPFAVFTERGTQVTGYRIYHNYAPLWFYAPPLVTLSSS